jgi:hypothetical protein
MPAIGGLPDMAKVSASGRLSLSGEFSAVSLAQQYFRFRARLTDMEITISLQV